MSSLFSNKTPAHEQKKSKKEKKSNPTGQKADSFQNTTFQMTKKKTSRRAILSNSIQMLKLKLKSKWIGTTDHSREPSPFFRKILNLKVYKFQMGMEVLVEPKPNSYGWQKVQRIKINKNCQT